MQKKKAKIKDIAQVIIGFGFKRDESVGEGITVIGIPEIKGRFRNKYVQENQVFNSKLILRTGDILIPRSEIDRFVYHFVTTDDLPAVAGNGVVVLRSIEGMEKEFELAFCSDQKMLELSKLVKRIYRGGTVRHLNIKDFREMEVSLTANKTIPAPERYPVNEFIIQNADNKGISYNEILKRIYILFEGRIKSLNVYVKSEEGKAYYVVDNKIAGSIDLFDY